MVKAASALDMQALGRRVALLMKDGDVVLLTGEMGAGKSEFCRGVARGLGIKGPIPSPSFTILNLYREGTMPLYHFDWYRIEDPEELYAAGLHEMVGAEGLTLIEWHERAPGLVPETHLEVAIEKQPDLSRLVTFRRAGGFRPLPELLLDVKGE